MPDASLNELDEVNVEKLIDAMAKHGYRVHNITDNGIALVDDISGGFGDVFIIPAGMGDNIPSTVVKNNLRDSRVSWNDILPELL